MDNTQDLFGGDRERFRIETPGRNDLPEKDGDGERRYRRINRSQTLLHTIDLERLVPGDHPVRAIWEMVRRLDMRGYEQGIKVREGGKGRSCHDPRVLMAIWIYGYSEGINSARELSYMCGLEPALQWLTGLQEVNYHTLADFRTAHGERLKGSFVEVLGLLSAEGLVDLKRVMQDGTKIKAQASSNSYRREETVREHLELAKKQVAEMGAADSDELSKRTRKARERAAREKQERLQKALQEFEERKQEKSDKPPRVSESDPQARIMKQAGGGFASSYNVQVSTDAANKVIVGVEATQAGTDYDQWVGGVERVKANTGALPEQSVVDGGYIKNANIEKAAELGVDLIGPVTENDPEGSYRKRGITPEFYPDQFRYDETANTFTCPAGKQLTYQRAGRRKVGRTEYQYSAQAADCAACPHKQNCSPKSASRSIVRGEDSDVVKTYRDKVQTAEVKAVYQRRAEVAETPNLWIKAKFGLRQFRLRGLLKVEIEAVWACLTYNVRQWIRLAWKPTQAAAVASAGAVRP